MAHFSDRGMSLVLMLALAACTAAPGQPTGSGDSEVTRPAEAEVHRANVVIDGQTLFAVRGVSAYPAERRASEIAQRIRAAGANPNINAKSLTVEERQGAMLILADGQRIMGVIDEDAVLEETTRQRLAQVYRGRIWEAIEAYRRDRQPAVLWLRALYAAVATIVLIIGALAGRRIIVLLRSALERRYTARLEGLQDRAHHVVKAEQIWRGLQSLLNVAWGLTIAVMLYAYLNYVLALFPWTRGFAKSLLAIAMDPLRTMGVGFVGIIPNLVFLVILAFVTRGALRIIRVLFDGVASGTVTLQGFDAEWAWPTYRLVRLLVIAFALVVAYPYIPGSESGAFKGVSLFIGIIFSLGSSSLIGNFIAGYSMTYRRAFKIGDRVKLGEYLGDVHEMRLLVTHLRTPKNEEVVVPNSTILNSEVVNFSTLARQRGLILHTTVGIGYETPWRQVEAMLLEAASRTPGLLREPRPFVLQTALGDFCITYEINVYCDAPHAMGLLYTELHRSILDVFNEYGVQIMTPAYEGDPEQPKIVPKEQWYTAPAQPLQSREPALSAGSTS